MNLPRIVPMFCLKRKQAVPKQAPPPVLSLPQIHASTDIYPTGNAPNVLGSPLLAAPFISLGGRSIGSDFFALTDPQPLSVCPDWFVHLRFF